MVRNFLLVLMSGLLWAACKTGDSNPVAPEYVIRGLLFFDYNALAVGKAGQPDDSLQVDRSKITFYPNPAKEHLSFIFTTRNTQTTSVTYKITHVLYPDAPDSLKVYYDYPISTMIPVTAENKAQVGQQVVRGTKIIPADTGWRSARVFIETKNYAKGFYRLFVETNTSTRLRVAFYKY